MQTFLPYPGFADSARCLDYRRLGKQRVEALQVLQTLRNPAAKGWVNHPAVLMWRGYERLLAHYGLTCCQEWIRRGYRDTLALRFATHICALPVPAEPPSWLGDERLHASHRSNLLRKLPEHYGRLGWSEPSDLPYYWPVMKRGVRV